MRCSNISSRHKLVFYEWVFLFIGQTKSNNIATTQAYHFDHVSWQWWTLIFKSTYIFRKTRSTSVSSACSEPRDWSSCSDRGTPFGYCSGHSCRVLKPYPTCAFSSRCYSSSTPSSGCRSVLSFLSLQFYIEIFKNGLAKFGGLIHYILN